MQTRIRFNSLLLVFMVLLVAGCASVPMASIDEDTRAKTFSVNPDKSGIYLYRNESFGGAIPMTVALDGKVAGQTGPKTYFLWETDPGSHDVSSNAENVSTLSISTEAGKTYFVWQEVKMGLWMARSQLQQVDEQTGRNAVSECERAKSSF